MAILLAYIETEPDPKPIPAGAYMKIRKIATAPHEAVTGGSRTDPPSALRGPVTITRPAGCKTVAPEVGLDPITEFNTRFNSQRFTSSCLASATRSKEKRRVTFAKKLDIIPPVCTDLVLYRAYGPDSFRLDTETRWLRKAFWSGIWIVGLLVMQYLSAVFFMASGVGFLKAFFV
jgi:hypothetical protein